MICFLSDEREAAGLTAHTASLSYERMGVMMKKLIFAGIFITAAAAVFMLCRFLQELSFSNKLNSSSGYRNRSVPSVSSPVLHQEIWQALHEENKNNSLEAAKNAYAFSVVDVSNFSDDMLSKLFYRTDISDPIEQMILNHSYVPNENISLSELKYLRVLHIGFDGKTHIGELIVNESIAGDILSIMKELYDNRYPIEKMVLIDQYEADDNRSMEANNSSAFNYRMIAGSTKLSKHSLGLAVDINPQYNPYIRKDAAGNTMIEPENGSEFTDRFKDFPYKIDAQDLCYQLFTAHGFTWGGDWNSVKDYQHFEK